MFCQCLTLLIPPLFDSFMIAGQKNLWCRAIFPLSWERIMRIFEQSIAEALILYRGMVSRYAWDQAQRRLKHRHRSDIAARALAR